MRRVRWVRTVGVVLGSCLAEEPVLRVEPAAQVAFVP
jgi:hypothetical protein